MSAYTVGFVLLLFAFAIWGAVQGVLGRFIGVGRAYGDAARRAGPRSIRAVGFGTAAMALTLAALILTGHFPTHR